MISVPMYIIIGLLKFLMVEGDISTNQYSQVTDDEGQQVCSVNAPSAVVYGVRRRVSCLLEHCVPTKACLSANYYTDNGKCELFHYHPTDFFRADEGCVHYKKHNSPNVNFCSGVGVASTIVTPECCSFPFSYNGTIFYNCTKNITDPSDIGCFREKRSWTACLYTNFKADYVSHNLTVPNIAQPVPSIFIHGWLIIQKNAPDGGSIFNRVNRPWIEYRNGFGDPGGKYFWFGNEKLYQLLATGNWKLRVEVQSNDTEKWYSAEYESFRLGSEASKYVLSVSGYAGDAGDAFNVASNNNWKSNGMKFTTFDEDNDNYPGGSCADGGWWWNWCGTSNLNSNRPTGNSWETLQLLGLAPSRCVSSARMMIKKA